MDDDDIVLNHNSSLDELKFTLDITIEDLLSHLDKYRVLCVDLNEEELKYEPPWVIRMKSKDLESDKSIAFPPHCYHISDNGTKVVFIQEAKLSNDKSLENLDKKLKKINSFLNALSTENFESVVKRVQKLSRKFYNSILIEDLVSKIFYKAISFKFSSLFGDFCSRLVNDDKLPYFIVKEKSGNILMKNFRRIFIN